MTFGEKAIDFFEKLELDVQLPESIEVMNPFRSEEVMGINRQFYKKYYDDNRERVFLFGINPGRFGAGVTGICFADPVRLEQVCGIVNSFAKKQELSSVFIFKVIEAYGGPEKFYRNFYITAISPLGFLKDGKNINYYDSKALQQAAEPFILETIREQIDLGAHCESAICLGEGANFNYFKKLNEKHGFFSEIIPLAHPRFILQYKRKSLDEYVKRYLDVLDNSQGK